MKNLVLKGILVLACAAFALSAHSQIEFFDDFEGAGLADDASPVGNGWIGNLIFPQGVPAAPGQFIFAFQGDAPNNTGAVDPSFGGIITDQVNGGGCDDNQFYNVFSVYGAGDVHAGGFPVLSNNFQERVINAADVGRTYIFQFDHRATQFPGNMLIPGDPSVFALGGFIAILDPPTNFSTVFRADAPTAMANDWTTSSLSVTIDASMVGDIIQFGFTVNATNFAPTGVWYDNVYFGENPPAAMLPAVAGSACDDGNPDTFGDAFNADCECVGGAPIPTLGEWGLMLMSLMLFIVGLVYIRQTSLQPIRQKK